MDRWAEEVIESLRRGAVFPAPEDELRAHASVMMWAAHRTPENSRVDECVKRVEELLSEPFDANLRVEVATMLLNYSSIALDVDAEQLATAAARPLLQSSNLTALRAFYYWGAEGYSHYVYGRYRDALACFGRADKLASEHGFQEAEFRSGVWRGLCQRRAGMLDKAEATLSRLERFVRPAKGVRSAVFGILQGLIEFDRGDLHRAIPIILQAYRSSAEQGYFTVSSIALFGLVAANIAIAGGRYEDARRVLARVRTEAHGPAANFLGAALLNEAWLAHRHGEQRLRDALLWKALERARDRRVRERLRWYPNALSELLPIALGEGIDPEMARRLIREFAVIPSGVAPEN